MRRPAERSNAKALSAKYWIEKLRLEPHPEGGYFRQTYKSELLVEPQASESSHSAESYVFEARGSFSVGSVANGATRVGQPTRAASTAIYFLLEGENFSAFHRLRSDEMWHFYAGTPLVVHVIDAAGEYSSILLGNGPEYGEVFQAVVRAGCWFASEVPENPHFSQMRREMGHPTYALVGCTVAPGFEFEDFELAEREALVRDFPKHQGLIERLTRK